MDDYKFFKFNILYVIYNFSSSCVTLFIILLENTMKRNFSLFCYKNILVLFSFIISLLFLYIQDVYTRRINEINEWEKRHLRNI